MSSVRAVHFCCLATRYLDSSPISAVFRSWLNCQLYNLSLTIWAKSLFNTNPDDTDWELSDKAFLCLWSDGHFWPIRLVVNVFEVLIAPWSLLPIVFLTEEKAHYSQMLISILFVSNHFLWLKLFGVSVQSEKISKRIFWLYYPIDWFNINFQKNMAVFNICLRTVLIAWRLCWFMSPAWCSCRVK